MDEKFIDTPGLEIPIFDKIFVFSPEDWFPAFFFHCSSWASGVQRREANGATAPGVQRQGASKQWN